MDFSTVVLILAAVVLIIWILSRVLDVPERDDEDSQW